MSHACAAGTTRIHSSHENLKSARTEALRLIREIIEDEASATGAINLNRKITVMDANGTALFEVPFGAALQ